MSATNQRSQSPNTQSLPSESSPGNIMDPDTPESSSKVVFAEPDSVSPLPSDNPKTSEQDEPMDTDKSSKRFRASMAKKRLSGRPSVERLGSLAKSSLANTPSISSILSEDTDMSKVSPKHRRTYERLSGQVHAWLQQEKTRRAARKAKKAGTKDTALDSGLPESSSTEQTHEPDFDRGRRDSEASEGSVALENLAGILERTLSLKSNESSPRKRRPSHGHRQKLSAIMKRQSIVSASDTDYFEGAEELVPGCEAVLDNSKTMAYSGGGPDSSEDDGNSKASRSAKKEKEAWAAFKYEILRITHTLKLKGWRRVPLDQANEIEVERLSGALTNAVYVVSPPKDLHSQSESKASLPTPKKLPPKLLLRIYGPQVEHLIDREAELQILRRLARKRIGPRLLGTFNNGRFEEFFHAQTLTFDDLRVPETSKQIAKRMRELHEGIELLRKEREGGPFVWRNWDKWVDRCEQVVTWLDQQAVETKDPRGLVCGAEWPLFRRTIEKYRKWLEEQYGGIHSVNERLVFAHNDAQYGNILRLMPAGESPLLLPANEHKQLVVIDFEYANANLPGLEFANHFTEWCYNYHSENPPPHVCSTKYYPTPEEQSRFIRAYLTHNPSFKSRPGPSTLTTPHVSTTSIPRTGSTTALAATAAPSSISAFMLDSRTPKGEKYNYEQQEEKAQEKTEQETKRLMAETRLWRLANSAQWTAWGIVQANIPGLPDFDAKEETEQGKVLDSATLEMRLEAEKEKEDRAEKGQREDGVDGETEQPPAEDEEFDYLAYAQERAMFVWGDAIQLGIIKAEELPEEVRKRVKLVEY